MVAEYTESFYNTQQAAPLPGVLAPGRGTNGRGASCTPCPPFVGDPTRLSREGGGRLFDFDLGPLVLLVRFAAALVVAAVVALAFRVNWRAGVVLCRVQRLLRSNG